MAEKSKSADKIELYAGRGTVMLIRPLAIDSVIKNYKADLVFQDLAAIESLLSQKFKQFNGIYDGNLKTGITVFFGWDSHLSPNPLVHVREAFQCGQDLQKEVAQMIRQDNRIRHPLFLLQIAIATDFFNVARNREQAERHQGFISEAYGLAQNIIEYCGIKSIILSTESEKILTHLGVSIDHKHEIRVRLPNSSRIITAYEFNIFSDDLESYKIVTNRIKSSISRRSDQERWNCRMGEISIEIDGEDYRLLNISRGGLEIEGEIPHIAGQIVTVRFKKVNSSLAASAEKLGFQDLSCEVRWNKDRGDINQIGLMFVSLDQMRKDELINFIMSSCQKRAEVS